MDGIEIRTDGGLWRRPKSKREIRDIVAIDPARVCVESTSMHGRGFDGTVDKLPEGKRIDFVGPDPYRSRKFYGSIEMRNGKLVVK